MKELEIPSIFLFLISVASRRLNFRQRESPFGTLKVVLIFILLLEFYQMSGTLYKNITLKAWLGKV